MIEKWGQLVDLLMENVFVTYFTIFFHEILIDNGIRSYL